MFECEVLADSVGPTGKRLTTVVVTYPRMVHAELLTHRMFSRNSASSRAIPNEKLRQRVIDNPAMPVWWGKNQSGMQAREELSTEVAWHEQYNCSLSPRDAAQRVWLGARDQMLRLSEELAAIGLHKQLCNRLIEPWMPITVIISATEWENFFRQRCHPDAQPEIRVAAEAIRDAMAKSEPQALEVGEWHLPLVREEDRAEFLDMNLVALSIARCARVSYLTHDGKRDSNMDFALYVRLKESGHWSPFEHAAQAIGDRHTDGSQRIGNFIGWRQHRADVDPHFIH